MAVAEADNLDALNVSCHATYTLYSIIFWVAGTTENLHRCVG